jgi:hypothetical protein
MALKGDHQGLKLNEAVFYWSLTCNKIIKNPAGLHQRGFLGLKESKLLSFFKCLSFSNNIIGDVLWARHVVCEFH